MLTSKENGRAIRGLALGVTVTLLAACANNLKPITDAEIKELQAENALLEKYEDLSQILEKDPDNKAAKQSLKKVGKVLATRDLKELKAKINGGLTTAGFLPKSLQDSLDPTLKNLNDWDAETYKQATALIGKAESKRRARLSNLQDQFNRHSADELKKKLELDSRIYTLNSDFDQRQQRRQTMFEQARGKASQWLEEKKFKQAVALLAILIEADENPASHELYADARFQDSLNSVQTLQQQGKVDEIHTVVIALLSEYKSEKYRQQLQSVVTDLASYYNLMAQNSLIEGDQAATYSHLSKVRHLTKAMPVMGLDRTIEQDFASQIYLQATEAAENQDLGAAMAYTSVLADLQPMTEELKVIQDQVNRQLYDRSVVKVASSAFDSPSNVPGLGSLITARLIERFLNEDQKDIRILERDNIDDVLKEQEIKALQEGSDVNISSADFLLQGAVLEASVDESNQATQKTKRVITDIQEDPNPEFKEWKQLSDSERERREKPEKTIKTEVKETIRYNITQHRKLGSVTASFRIINPSNAKLVHAESLQEEQKYEGVSNEGVEIGLFILPAENAQLPASNKILRELTQKLADQIGDKLLEQLNNPERRYLQQAEQLQTAGDLKGATSAMGKAVAMLKAKGLEHQEQLNALKLLALSTN
ncbi:hypothetical protein [Marinobacterium jannaschii]|uniref:hypothetical protein n=1 Tax=Marinobacterium jannaschii TaxID=64970 RepID=UPI000482D7DE|nr:hypothetical protein [Marinobacterium jannaschii]